MTKTATLARRSSSAVPVVVLVGALAQTQQTEAVGLPDNWFNDIIAPAARDVRQVFLNEVMICAHTAAALLEVPRIAAAHRACVAQLLDAGTLSQSALDAACAPLARWRVRPTETIACEGRAAVIAQMDPARRPSA